MNILKKSYILLAFACLTLAGCKDEIYTDLNIFQPALTSNYVAVYPVSLEFDNYSETRYVDVSTGEKSNWSVMNIPDWLTADKSEGQGKDAFSLTSSPNEYGTAREAVMNVTLVDNEAASAVLTASQKAATPYITFNDVVENNKTVTAAAGSFQTTISTNIPALKVVVGESYNEWLSASYSEVNMTLTVNYTENLLDYSRSGIVSLQSEDGSFYENLQVTQAVADITSDSDTNYSVPASGEQYNINFSSEASWSAKTSVSWIEVTPSDGKSGSNTVKVNVLPTSSGYSREGYVYIGTGDNKQLIYKFTQESLYITPFAREVTIGYEEAATTTMTIDANVKWKIKERPDWVFFSPGTGNPGKTVVTVKASKNNSLVPRTGTVYLSDESGAFTTQFEVHQNSVIDKDSFSIKFDNKASSQSLTIPFVKDWSLRFGTDCDWLTVSEMAGNGAANLTISVTANPDEDSRHATLYATSEGVDIKINIVQSGSYIKLSETTGEVDANGGTIELSIDATVDYTTTVVYGNTPYQNWVTVSEGNEGVHTITVSANPSSNTRNATAVFTNPDLAGTDNVGGVKFEIIQTGRSLSLSNNALFISKSGGQSDIVTVKAIGEYEVVKDDSEWFSLTFDEATNTFYVEAQENTNSTARTGSITVRLLNLPDGEEKSVTIPVTQSSITGYFDVTATDDYDHEETI